LIPGGARAKLCRAMGAPTEPRLVKPIVGLLASSEALLEEAGAALASAIAPVASATEPYRWELSDYYRREMGETIWRRFAALEGVVAADSLVELKLQANELEQRWRAARGRRVNIDPGYVDLGKLVLASTKDAAHRVYLARGIYAEATLRYAAGRFLPWPYTYPDYAAPDALTFFTRVRESYRAEAVFPEEAPVPRGD